MLTSKATFAYYVPDPGEAADWYRDRLDFEIVADHRDAAPVRYCVAAPPGATWQFAFSDVNVHGEGELAERFRAEIGFAPHFMLAVDDLEASLEVWRGRGVEILEEPHPAPWGRAAAIKDLYGDSITIVDEAGFASFRR